MQKTHIGIDFGTTNTAVVAVLVDGTDHKIQHLGENGEYPFSSIVAIPKDNNGEFLFGRAVKAKRQELSKTHHIITSIKGFLNENTEIVTDDGKRYSAVEITALFLKYVKEYIHTAHNINITSATMSFPVDFKPEGRRALEQAANHAGIKVNGFISESTAAYIANREQSKAYSKVLVLDWGGGTIDVSLLSCHDNQLHELSVMGDQIGGDDIDRALAQNTHAKLISKSGLQIAFSEMDAHHRDMMIAKAEQVKMDFESEDETYLTLANYGKFGTKTEEITYEEFCGIIKPIIERTLQVIDTTLNQGHVTHHGVDAVILVGGSSELRLFYEVISEIFGEQKILTADKRQWSVANGAAFIDISGGEYYLNDDVCVELSDGVLFPILKKNQSKVGCVQPPISFGLTTDSTDAHFIFKNSNGRIPYGAISVNTKGFLTENLVLNCQIDINQIATIHIENKSMGESYSVHHQINKLNYYYDLSHI